MYKLILLTGMIILLIATPVYGGLEVGYKYNDTSAVVILPPEEDTSVLDEATFSLLVNGTWYDTGTAMRLNETVSQNVVINGDVGIGSEDPLTDLDINKTEDSITTLRVRNVMSDAGAGGRLQTQSESSTGLITSYSSSAFGNRYGAGSEYADSFEIVQTQGDKMMIGTDGLANPIIFGTAGTIRLTIGADGILTSTGTHKFTSADSNTLLTMPDYTGAGVWYPFAYQQPGLVWDTGLVFNETGGYIGINLLGNSVIRFFTAGHLTTNGDIISGGTVQGGTLTSTGGLTVINNGNVGNRMNVGYINQTSSDESHFQGDVNITGRLMTNTISSIPQPTPNGRLNLDGNIYVGDCLDIGGYIVNECPANAGVLTLGGGSDAPVTEESMYTNSKGFFNASIVKVPALRSTGSIGVGTDNPASPFHLYENHASALGSAAGYTLEQDGAGDAGFNFLLTGAERWLFGVDNDQNDRLVFDESNTLGTNPILVLDPTDHWVRVVNNLITNGSISVESGQDVCIDGGSCLSSPVSIYTQQYEFFDENALPVNNYIKVGDNNIQMGTGQPIMQNGTIVGITHTSSIIGECTALPNCYVAKIDHTGSETAYFDTNITIGANGNGTNYNSGRYSDPHQADWKDLEVMEGEAIVLKCLTKTCSVEPSEHMLQVIVKTNTSVAPW